MSKVHNPVAWVGVVAVHDDGSTYAIELDGRRQRITWEIAQEVEVQEDPFATGPFRRFEPGTRTIDIHVRGVGGNWAAGFRAARVPHQAIAESLKVIEGARTGEVNEWTS